MITHDLYFEDFDDYCHFLSHLLDTELWAVKRSVLDDYKREILQQLYAEWKRWV